MLLKINQKQKKKPKNIFHLITILSVCFRYKNPRTLHIDPFTIELLFTYAPKKFNLNLNLFTYRVLQSIVAF